MALFSIQAVKAMFPPTAYGNIDTYFPEMEKKLDAKLASLGGNQSAGNPLVTVNGFINSSNVQIRMSKVDLESLRLKLYFYTTIRCESDSFRPIDEDLSRLNTPLLVPAPPPPSILTGPPATGSGYHLPEQQPTTTARPHLLRPHLHPHHPPLDRSRAYQLYDKSIVNKTQGIAKSDLKGIDLHGLGAQYHGRGFIQLTGLCNYIRYGKLAGIDHLALHPEMANEPNNAERIAIEYIFDGHHRELILAALEMRDWKAARAVVNGGGKKKKHGKPKPLNPNGMEHFIPAYLAGEKVVFSVPDMRRQSA